MRAQLKVQPTLSAGGFGLRLLSALLLVLLTYNPSGYSYWHWISAQFPHVQPLALALGLALVICWVVFLGAAMQSLGIAGVILLLGFFAALAWAAADYHLLSLGSGGAITWVALIVIGIVLGVGLCWSHWRRRLTGQTDVEEVDSH